MNGGWQAFRVVFAGGVLVSLALGLLHAPSTGADSVIANGGFEQVDSTGRPTGWLVVAGTLTATTPSFEGARAARLAADGIQPAVAFQTIPVSEGAHLDLQVQVRGTGSPATTVELGVVFMVADRDGNLIEWPELRSLPLSPANGVWQAIDLAADAPKRAERARVFLRTAATDPGAVADLDSFTVVVQGGWTATATATATRTATAGAAPSPFASATPVPFRSATPVLPTAAPATPTATSPPARSPQPGDILITEVMAAPTQTPESAFEWVEIANAADGPLDLAGCLLADNGGSLPVGTLGVLPPGGIALIAASPAALDNAAVASVPNTVFSGGRIAGSLRNGGDRLVLSCAGAVIDQLSWGDETSVLLPAAPAASDGRSLERRPWLASGRGGADFVLSSRPSPGRRPLPLSTALFLPLVFRDTVAGW